MEEDPTLTEPGPGAGPGPGPGPEAGGSTTGTMGSTTGTMGGSTHTLPQSQTPEVQFIPSFSPSSAPASPTPTGTLSRLGLKLPGSPTPAASGSPADRGQVSAITVVALLDQLVHMLESVQDNQQRMEHRQAELEGAVRVVQGDVSRLSKAHACTSSNVGKLLERSRKMGGNVKEVRERLDKQSAQVKRLENNHAHLLKRNHFKVLIFQEDNEIPTTVSVKDSLKTPQPSQYDAESTRPLPSIAGSVDGSRTIEEGLQTISLSSDEDGSMATTHREDEEMFEGYVAAGGSSRTFERRADKFKRNSLKKVDSLKKAFSRQSIEKKVNQITTKIVPPEKREKIKKSLTPNHSKSPTTKSSSFKVSPMTFNVKKVREGEVPQEMSSPVEGAHIEIVPLGNTDGEFPLAEVHTEQEENEVREEVQEMLNPSSPESIQAKVEIKECSPKSECEMNGDSLAGLAVPEHDEDIEEEEEEEGEGEEGEGEPKEDQGEKVKSPVETTADVQVSPTSISVEQVS